MLPASKLHLEVPCFAVRPAAVPSVAAVEATKSALAHAGSEEGSGAEAMRGDQPNTSVEFARNTSIGQRCTVSVPTATLPTNTSARSDENGQLRPGDRNTVNANLSGEPSGILSRGTAETEQNSSENAADAFGPVGSAARSELALWQQLGFAAVPVAPSSVNSTESAVSQDRVGRRRRSEGGVRGGRGRHLTSSAPQPSSTTLTYSELPK